MKFNLTIKNNETGEIIKSLDCDAIIGGIHTGKDTSATIVLTECDMFSPFTTFKAAEKAIAHVLENDDDIKMISMLDQLNELKEASEERADEDVE